MRVIERSGIIGASRRDLGRKKPGKFVFICTILFSVLVLHSFLAYFKLIPTAEITYEKPDNQDSVSVNIAWPNDGQAAIGDDVSGLLGSSDNHKPMPTASVIKVLTALMILKKYPLAINQQGPTITINRQDVDSYNYYLSHDGSNTAVQLGEQITEYQALQALILPSSNNMAETLVRWAYGSKENYLIEANKIAASLGMTNTFIADGSGFDPKTVSTAHDLVLLGVEVMKNPVLAEIVSQKTAKIPVASNISSTNFLLGQNEYVGIKTGHTDEAGGCYLFSTKHKFADGHEVVVIGAIMGSKTIKSAMEDSLPLLQNVYTNYAVKNIVKKDQKVATYKTAWGENVDAVASNDQTIFGWNALNPKPVYKINEIKSGTAGDAVGDLLIDSGYEKKSIKIKLKNDINPPSFWWRINRWAF